MHMSQTHLVVLILNKKLISQSVSCSIISYITLYELPIMRIEKPKQFEFVTCTGDVSDIYGFPNRFVCNKSIPSIGKTETDSLYIAMSQC